MSKIDKYNMYMYSSINAALRELMNPYMVIDNENFELVCAFTAEAYEDVATFLCLNDIKHTFVINDPNERLGARVVTVSWEIAGETRNLAWWEIIEEECYLVKFEENWADEMNIYAFAVFSAKEYRCWRHAMARLEKAMEKAVFTYCFGTNEEQEYDTFAEFDQCFTVKPITNDEANTIRDTFNIATYYGDFPGVDGLNYYLEDMEADK